MPKLSDNGTNIVRQDFGKKIGVAEYNVDDYPENVQRYLMLRGARKYFSDQGAGFEGTEEQLAEKCAKSHERLLAGDFRSSGDRGVSVQELTDIFLTLAPEASANAIQERVKAMHPDFAKGEKDKTKRQRKVREIVNAHKALQF